MGRSLRVLTGARGVSQAASRSYVFGRDDSNSTAALADSSGNTSVVRIWRFCIVSNKEPNCSSGSCE